jgi:Uncharacterized proteins, homologs of microcin C7 resistance protein MccF
VEKKAV